MGSILKSKWFRATAIVALLLGLYAFLGFRVAPGLIRDRAIAAVRDTYGRELQIGAVCVQPFKLQLELRDVVFPDRDRQAMLSLRRLFVDFELASLWRCAWVFRDLDFEGPAVRAVLRRDGSLNLADLSPPPAADAPATGPKAEYLELAGRQKSFVRGLSPVGFTLKDFRTTPAGGAFRLAARSGEGEQFDWSGRFALSPQIASEGEFAVAGLALRARGVGEDWVTIPTLTVSDTAVSLPEQSVTIGSIVSSGLKAEAWLNPDGSINVTQLFAPVPVAPGVAAATTQVDAAGRPWTVRLASLEVLGSGIDFEDRSRAPAKRFRVGPLDLRVRDASLDLAKPLPLTLEATI